MTEKYKRSNQNFYSAEAVSVTELSQISEIDNIYNNAMKMSLLYPKASLPNNKSKDMDKGHDLQIISLNFFI